MHTTYIPTWLLTLPLWLGCTTEAPNAPVAPLPVFASTTETRAAREVTRYDLSAQLDPQRHEIQGSGTLTFTNTSDQPLDHLWLHLYLNAFKNERSVFLREQSSGFRGHHDTMKWGWINLQSLCVQTTDNSSIELLGARLPNDDPHDESELGVRLPSPLAVGDSLTVTMRFTALLPSIVLRTGHAGNFHMAGQWFPKLAKLEPGGFAHFPFHRFSEFYADFGSYRVTLEVPSRYVVGATGALRSSEEFPAGSLRGPFRRDVYEASDVHDFAFTAWDEFRSRSERVGEVDIKMLYPAGFEAAAERELAALRFAIPHYAARYGSYPYPTLTVVHPPANAAEAGGMEYPTLITTGGDPRTPGFARNLEAVTVHEFGHQYFYGLLASNEHHAPFLDEGLNSFAEIDALERWLGPRTAGAALGVVRFGVADVHALSGRRYVRDAQVDLPAMDFPSGGAYGAQVYSRTASLLATLARTYGEERFFTMLGTYTRRFRFAHPREDDLLACVAEFLGDEARAFLHEGLHASGTLDVAVLEAKSARRREPGGLFDEGGERAPENGDDYVSAALLTRRGALRLPIDVELRFRDGTRERRVWQSAGSPIGATEWWSSESTEPLTAIVLDPERKLLVDDNWENNTLLLERKNPKATPLLGGSLGLLLAELL